MMKKLYEEELTLEASPIPVPRELDKFVRRCTAQDPSNRPTAQQALFTLNQLRDDVTKH